jgi:hypothetical protein
MAVFPNGITGYGHAVLRLPDAAGVHDSHTIQVHREGQVRMSREDDIGL